MKQNNFFDRRKSILSKDNTDCLKGLFAITIVFSHIRSSGGGTALNNSLIGMALTAAGYLSVAMFFFITGYGLRVSQLQKGDAYLRDFPVKRLLSFYLKYLLLSFVYVVVFFIKKHTLEGSFTYQNLLMVKINFANSWYIQAIFLSYLLFFLIEKFTRFSTLLKSTLVFACYLGLCIAFAPSFERYIQAYPALIAGLIYPTVKPQVEKFLSKKCIFILSYFGVFIAFCICLLLGHKESAPENLWLIFKMLSALFFVAFVLMTSVFIPLSNGVFKFLADRSLEIYVLQAIFLDAFSTVLKSFGILAYGALVLFCTILAAIVYHPVLQLTDKLSNKILSWRNAP